MDLQVSVGSTDVNNPCTGVLGTGTATGPYEDIMFRIVNNSSSTPVNVNTLTIVGWFNESVGPASWGGDEYRSMIYNSTGTLQVPTAGITGTAATSTSGSYHMLTFGFKTSGTIPPGGGYFLAGTAATNPFWQLVNSTTGALTFDPSCNNYSGLETGVGGSDGAGGVYYTAGTYYSNPHWMLYENGLPVCQITSAGQPDPNSGIPATGATCLCPGVTPSPTPTPTALGSTATPTQPPYGASLPYSEYEAEAATQYTGTLIGNVNTPSSWLQTWSGATLSNSQTVELAAEASGREAVQLSSNGQLVKFTTGADSNAIVVRYSLPAGTGNTTLSCIATSAGGTVLFTQQLAMTSNYMYFYGAWPVSSPITGYNTSGSNPFHLYDEMHTLFGTITAPTTVPAGSTITLEKMTANGNNAASYTIDFIDLEMVGAQATMPGGYTSITAYGATGNGTTDDSGAIQNALNAVTKVWIPAGTYYCNKGANFTVPSNCTVAGAGMWYSTLSSENSYGAGYFLGFNVGATGDVFNNFCVQGGCTNRNDNTANSGFYYECGSNSSLTNVWVEHEKCGYWVGQTGNSNQVANGLQITGCRFRDLYADGVNLNDGASNCTISNCNFRYTGDDSIAIWSYNSGYGEESGNSATHNTIQLPWRADGIAIYGGGPYTVNNNLVEDTLDQCGILVSYEFTPISAFTGTTSISGNYLLRCGGEWDGGISGAIEFWGDSGSISPGVFSSTGNSVINSCYMGFLFNGPCGNLGTLNNQIITGSQSYGIQVYSGSTGSITFTSPSITGSGLGSTLNSATGFTLTQN